MQHTQIKFSTKIKPEFIDELRERVKEYFEKNKISKYGNWEIVVKAILVMILYFVPYILMLTNMVESIQYIFICWILMGIGMAGVGMGIMHDANHGSFSNNQKINSFLSKSLYLLGGYPPNWRFQHNTLHHGYTNIEGHDEDIGHDGILRFSPHKPHYWFHQYQYLYAWILYGLMTLSWVTIKDFNRISKYKKMNAVLSNIKNYNQLYFELIVSKVLYYSLFLILPMVLIPIDWYWVLIFFFVMHFVGGSILTAIFQTAHVMPTSDFPLPDNNGHIENSWAVHQLQTTTDYSPKSKIFSWFIGGLNYQVEHHLFPNISHVHYKNIAPIVRETAMKYQVPYHSEHNFIQALKSHIRMLKSLGRLKTYPNI